MAIKDNKTFAADRRADPLGSGSARAPTVSIQSWLGDVEAGFTALQKKIDDGFLAVKNAQEGLDRKLDNLLSLVKDLDRTEWRESSQTLTKIISNVTWNHRWRKEYLPQSQRDATAKKRNSPYIKSMRSSALVSSGERKPREIDIRTNVYENEDFIYQRNVKSSRTFLSEVYESEYKITDTDIKQLLTSSTQKKKNKKKKKKGTGNPGTGENNIETMDAVEDDGDEDFEDEPEQPVKKTTSQKVKSTKSKS
ncbi:unnamed protein product [Adineta ricciae]|uniref:Uncharacterized protein n=1 Tax=Adineta ricciae TaxID=249248 RepID=A0A814MZM0_ADIRI|nr:unnamed protein product [Adineta ricciae]CAF1620213.1 unnamed protein product [Adineta ricciae]